ncbi:MAG: T9SS type A sorting domain-containing protein [Chitinophagaceae bacterium]|nr:T9SS type A sorting domain-containing protein [Chitinophagaceae bacterium]
MKQIYTLLITLMVTIGLQAQSFSWNNFNDGSTSYNVTSNNVKMTVSIAGSGHASGEPSYNSSNGGYLYESVDWSNKTTTITYTITFTVPLKGVYFYVYDVDYSNGGWDDKLTISAKNNVNTTVYPAISAGSSAEVTGTNLNILEGKGNNSSFSSNPSYVSFGTSVPVKTLTIVYGAGNNSPSNPNGQVIGFSMVGSIEALPVQLLGFSAAKSGTNNALIKWETDKQIRFDHFELERSATAVGPFEKVADIASNNAVTGSYSYTDMNVKSKMATAYYRLKMVDIDGTYSYSRVAMIRFTGGATFDVRPTLLHAGENLNVTVSSNENENYTIKLFNLSGKMVAQQNIARSGQVALNTAGLQKGMYVVTVEGGSEPQTFKVMIQ